MSNKENNNLLEQLQNSHHLSTTADLLRVMAEAGRRSGKTDRLTNRLRLAAQDLVVTATAMSPKDTRQILDLYATTQLDPIPGVETLVRQVLNRHAAFMKQPPTAVSQDLEEKDAALVDTVRSRLLAMANQGPAHSRQAAVSTMGMFASKQRAALAATQQPLARPEAKKSSGSLNRRRRP